MANQDLTIQGLPGGIHTTVYIDPSSEGSNYGAHAWALYNLLRSSVPQGTWEVFVGLVEGDEEKCRCGSAGFETPCPEGHEGTITIHTTYGGKDHNYDFLEDATALDRFLRSSIPCTTLDLLREKMNRGSDNITVSSSKNLEGPDTVTVHAAYSGKGILPYQEDSNTLFNFLVGNIPYQTFNLLRARIREWEQPK